MPANPCGSCGGVCACRIVYEDGQALPGDGTLGNPYVVGLCALMGKLRATLGPPGRAALATDQFLVLDATGACVNVGLPPVPALDCEEVQDCVGAMLNTVGFVYNDGADRWDAQPALPGTVLTNDGAGGANWQPVVTGPQCPTAFQYLGSARWDDGVRAIGSGITPATGPILAGPFSSVQPRVVTNTSPTCDMAIILGYDLFAAFDVVAGGSAGLGLGYAASLNMTGFINGIPHATVSCFSTYISVTTNPNLATSEVRIRTPALASANPLGAVVGFIGPSPIEDGTPAIILPPGGSATFDVQLSLTQYAGGAPSPGDIIDGIASAIRLYGYYV